MTMTNHEDIPEKDEFDTPWKEIVRTCFQEFIAFFLPVAHVGIDWSRECEFLDKELARITREAETGDRRVDQLVKVWQLDGHEQWVLIHAEIHGNRQARFSERMFTYQYRAFDLGHRPVVGLAILADDDSGWRPVEFVYELWETRLVYRFKVVKLIDYLQQLEVLQQSANPFAIVTLAHLAAKLTRNRPELRYREKMGITRSLYQRGFTRQKIIDLFRFIDWVLNLSKENDTRFWNELSQFEETQKMPYITSVERIGEQRGMLSGMLLGEQKGERKRAVQTLLRLLTLQFGPLPEGIQEKISGAELEKLDLWTDQVLKARSLEEVLV
ncbi:MAG: hypothetical protein HQL95_15280 [Magnetococcales bacterium]|nr:hypothetical protein [Magnetococcales bacterium]